MDNNRIKDADELLAELFGRYPELTVCKDSIVAAYETLLASFRSGGKLLIAGNGGSAADCDHISGELTKSFRFKRKADPSVVSALAEDFGEDGKRLADSLEGGLPAIPLPLMSASNSAFANDVEWPSSYAQLVNALAAPNDVFLGITTSGNSADIVNAFMVAKAKGVRTVALTGKTGGRCKGLADICIIVPENETFKIQERHLPIYHALCSMVEVSLFAPRSV